MQVTFLREAEPRHLFLFTQLQSSDFCIFTLEDGPGTHFLQQSPLPNTHLFQAGFAE